MASSTSLFRHFLTRMAQANICLGRLLFMYKLDRLLANQETGDLTKKDIDRILASAATHEVAHTLEAVHIFRIVNGGQIPAEGYFMGSIIGYADPSMRFHEQNIARMKNFIALAKQANQNIHTLNELKNSSLGTLIILNTP